MNIILIYVLQKFFYWWINLNFFKGILNVINLDLLNYLLLEQFKIRIYYGLK